MDRTKASLIGLLSLLLALALSGCGASTAARGNIAERQVRVTTTVGMISDIVLNVGGDRVTVTGLMGPGVDPHLYKPSASDIKKLEDADIVFYGGLHLEGRMAEIFEKQAERGFLTVAVSRDIPEDLLRTPPEFAGSHDPHIWFDVTLWQAAARTVAKELAALDPGSSAVYQANAEAYLKQLDELNQYIKQQVATVPADSRVLITAHDAFGYFGDQYGFEVRGLQGVSTASEAGAGDVQGLADFIATRKIKAIFVESSVPQATIEAVQQAVNSRGWQVRIGGQLFSDAMGNQGTPEGTYIGMVRYNVDTIVGALK